jgi:hypothetical protein
MPRPSAAGVRERERRAIELHLGGWTLERIADELGYANASGPQKAIARAMERHIAADVAEQRALDIARLEKMLEAVWPTVTASLVTEQEKAEDQVSAKVLLARVRHQHDAIDRAVKIIERRAKTIGYDAPTKAEVTGNITITDDEFTQALTDWALDPEKIAEYQRDKDAQEQVSG